MKALDRIVIIIFNISLLLVTIWAIIIPITKSKGFYEYEFKKNDTASDTCWYVYEDNARYCYDDEDLSIIIEQVIDYLMNKTDDMQVEIDGRLVFSNQALIHMKDVKRLYTGGNTIGWILLFVLIGCLAYIIVFFKRIKKILFKYTMFSLGAIVLVILAYGVYALIDFNGAFDLFHVLAFPTEQQYNDSAFSSVSNYEELYYINNLTLTNILTIDVFMDAAIAIFAGVILVIGGWCTFTFITYRRVKKVEKGKLQN